MKLPEIDFEKVRAIILRAGELEHNGKMDRDSWLALVREFGEVCHWRLEMPGIFSRTGETEWFDELHKTSQRVA